MTCTPDADFESGDLQEETSSGWKDNNEGWKMLEDVLPTYGL